MSELSRQLIRDALDPRKKCTVCGELKERDQFHLQGDGRRLRANCKTCQNSRGREHYRQHLARPKVRLQCAECAQFFERAYVGYGGRRTFCSLACQRICFNREQRGKYPRKPGNRPCPVCDAVFQDGSRSNTRKYCSDRCKHLAKRVKLYGGTVEDMRRLYAHADVCAACQGDFYRDDGWGRVMEHCHDTKRIRGITHQKCNTGLGCADHDLEKLYRWQVYLARHSFDLVDLCHAT